MLDVTVLMPVYNSEKYIAQAVESILNQSFRAFEFIIINDGANDATTAILNNYAVKDSRIRLINQSNQGIVAALNRGLSESKGKWIFRMDHDDIALPHRLECQMEEIKQNPDLILLGGWVLQIDSNGISLKTTKYPADHDALINQLESKMSFFAHPTACFRRDIVTKIGGYRERFCCAEDYDLWLRLSSIGKFSCCQNVILKLRRHDASMSSQFDSTQVLKTIAACVCYFLNKKNEIDPSKMPDNFWNSFLAWLEDELEQRKFFEMCKCWESFKKHWYKYRSLNAIPRAWFVVMELLQNPLAIKAFVQRYKKTNICYDLAEKFQRFNLEGKLQE